MMADDKKNEGLFGDLNDAKDLIFNYVKQETFEPLKQLKNHLIFGSLGAICVSIGMVFLSLSFLRLLQEETSIFHGNLNFIPYLIVLVIDTVVLAILTAISYKNIFKSKENL